jgi:hypothetical protein
MGNIFRICTGFLRISHEENNEENNEDSHNLIKESISEMKNDMNEHIPVHNRKLQRIYTIQKNFGSTQTNSVEKDLEKRFGF